MTAGRPTKYTKALLDKCRVYMDTYQDEGDIIPSHVGLFLFLGISKTCAYDWKNEEDKKEFSAILDELMIMQERALFNGGLSNSMNSAIVKLALGKHGYSDKQQQEINATIGLANLSDKQIDQRIESLCESKSKD